MASEISLSSMPSPMYYWVKSFLAYMMSNLWSNLAQVSARNSELGEILKGAVGHDIVVWLHHGRGHLGGGVGHKLQFGLLAVVHGVTLHGKGSDADAGSSTEGDVDEETVQPGDHLKVFVSHRQQN